MNRIQTWANKDGPLLYLVATPIGNLGDTSERMKEVLQNVDEIYAEDTRNTGNLLKLLNISKPLYSLYSQTEEKKSEGIILKMVEKNLKVAYMSDAGYPGISDPGTQLAKAATQYSVPVTAIPGPSAFLQTLVVSGLNITRFYFHGFLPANRGKCLKELEALKTKTEALIFYEAPHRIHETLSYLFEVLGSRPAVIGRELTKIHEEIIRGTLDELMEIDKNSLIGEMVIIVEGNPKIKELLNDDEIMKHIEELKKEAKSSTEILNILLEETSLPKNKLYKLIHQ